MVILWLCLSAMAWALPAAGINVKLGKNIVPAHTVGTYTHGQLLKCTPAIEAVYQYSAVDGIRVLPKHLRAGTTYSCSVNEALLPGADTTPFNIKAPAFDIEELRYYPDGVFRIVFNDYVNKDALKSSLKVYRLNKLSRTQLGVSVEVSGKTAVVRIDEQVENTRVAIELLSSLKSIYGAALAQNISKEFDGNEVAYRLDPSKRTMQVPDAPRSNALDNGKLAIRLYFYSWPDEASLKKYIRIEGVRTFSIGRSDYISYYERRERHLSENSYYYADIEADFEPGKEYSITLLKGLKDNYSQLRSGRRYRVKMPDRKSFLAFESDKPYISSLGEIGFESVNVSKISIVAEKLLEQNRRFFLTLAGGNGSNLQKMGREVLSKTFDIGGEKNCFVRHKISLKPFMKEWQSGIYRIFIHYGNDRVASKTVYFSDLGIAAKISKDQLFVSVAALSSAKAIGGAKFKLYSSRNEVILEGVTDENGIAVIDRAGIAKESPAALEVISAKERNFLILNSALNDTVDTGDNGIKNRYRAFIYLQSILVRPGEKASMLVVVKDRQYRSASKLPVEVEIKDPMGKTAYKEVVATNKAGAFTLELFMPESYRTGRYSVSVRFADKRIGSASYTLETFMPQRISSKIALSSEYVTLKESVDANLSSDYLFGAPAAGLKAEARITAVAKNYSHPDYADYSFTNTLLSRENAINYLDMKQEFTLDESGRHNAVFPLLIKQMPPSILTAQVGFTVFDDGRPVSAYRQLDIYPYGSMTGVYVQNSSIETGAKLLFKTVAIDPITGKTSDRELDVTIKRCSWHYSYDSSGYYHWDRECETVDTFTVRSQKLIRREMRRSGDYVIEVADRIGGHSSTADIRVSGWDYSPISPTDDFAKNEVVFEDILYKKGDTLHADIKSPIIKGCLLVTVETDKVKWFKTFEISKGSASVDIKLDFDLEQGAYLFTSAVRSTDKEAALVPYRAKSYSFIRPDREKYRIKTTIRSAERSESGRDYAVEVSSRPGSYVVISVVDKGILQILGQKPPKAFEFFNERVGQRVSYFDLYDRVMQYLTTGKMLSFGGDDTLSLAKSRKHLAPKSGAKRVKPFVYWSGLLKTGSDGRVEVNVPIGEFNGRAEIVAVSIDENAIGVGSKEFTVKDDLVIKPVFPRFMHVGDSLVVPVRVFNTTDEKISAALMVETSENMAASDLLHIVDIAPKSFRIMELELNATGTGRGDVDIVAFVGLKRFDSRVELPIIQPGSLVTKTLHGEVRDSRKIKIPKKYMMKDGTAAEIALSNTFLSRMDKSVSRLIGYPYGCAEQTASKLLAMANMEPFIHERNATIRADLLEDRDRFVHQGIKKLSDMQKSSGEFSYWSLDGYVNIFASVYASDVLLMLHKNGYSVPEPVLAGIYRSLDRLSKGYGSYRYGRTSDFVQLYAAYLLSRSDRLENSTVNALYDKKRYQGSLVDMYLIAAILNRSGNSKALQQVLEEIEDYDLYKMSGRRECGNSFYSKVRDIAFALYLHVTNFSKNDLSYRLLDMLASDMKNIRSTQERAFAMRALTVYYGKDASVKQMDAVLGVNGKKEHFTQPVNVNRLLRDDTVTIESKAGPVNYAIDISRYLPKPIKHTALNGNSGMLAVTRDYVDSNGRSVPLDAVVQGTLLYSKVSVKSFDRLDNIAIADRIPACFEIVNERTNRMRRSNKTRNSTNFRPDYQDYRDDRVLTFISLPLPSKSHPNTVTFLTPMRAVSKGECRLPALVAEAMYDPRISDYDKAAESIRIMDGRDIKDSIAEKVKTGLRYKW